MSSKTGNALARNVVEWLDADGRHHRDLVWSPGMKVPKYYAETWWIPRLGTAAFTLIGIRHGDKTKTLREIFTIDDGYEEVEVDSSGQVDKTWLEQKLKAS